MKNVKNSILLESVLKALYTVTDRRTSGRLANKTIGSTLKTLEESYDFLKYVQVDQQSFSADSFTVNIQSDIDTVEPYKLGKAIESIIRIVYTDLDVEAGLYFIAEFKQHTGNRINSVMEHCNIDLGQLQIEQNHFFQRLEKRQSFDDADEQTEDEKKQSAINKLGYTWDSVSQWKHEPDSNYCVLYDTKGNVLDRLNLDTILQSYVEKLSGYSGAPPEEYEDQIEIYEKEYHLLELMYSRDMDAQSASEQLNISEDELNRMIRKLSEIQLLHYISNDVVELTDAGMSYLSKKGKKK